MNCKDQVSVSTDGSGRPVAAAGPGLVDLQLNGYGGVSFNGAVEQLTVQNVRRVCQRLRQRGVVMVLVTFGTDTVERMLERAGRLAELRRQDELIAATVAGFHVEGPMISAEDGPRGAHAAEFIIAPADRPRILEEFQQASGGLVRIFTLAPELPGAMELIAAAAGSGVLPALGHHAASGQVLEEAVAAGARMCTHLGNGSHALIPRLDNYIMRQLADDRLAASFIADGHHIPFPTLKNFIRAKQPQRSLLVSDAVMVADMPPGRYGSGRRVRELGPDGAVRLPGTPYLAGSALTLDRAVLNVVANCDVSFQTAWAMASSQPAALVGLPAPQHVEVELSAQGFSLRP